MIQSDSLASTSSACCSPRNNNNAINGDIDTVVDAAYLAWRADTEAGKQTLLIAADHDTGAALNARAHADLVTAGRVADRGVVLADGLAVGVGDRVVTRRNDHALITRGGWVKNGDRWTVLDSSGDGSLVVQRQRGAGIAWLPADYVTDHVELGYAITACRAQVTTVDSAHCVVTRP